MSIKIWTAYKVPLNRLIEATQWLHNYQAQDAYNWFRNAANQCDRDTDKLAKLREWIIQATCNDSFSPADLSRGFHCWLDTDYQYAYIIPYGYFPKTENLPNWFEDYHYQNQVDPPEDVPEGEYRARGVKWEEVGAFHYDRTLTHQTISSAVDIYEIERKWIESEYRFANEDMLDRSTVPK